MTDQELTFDQLQTVVGGIIHPNYKRNARRVETNQFLPWHREYLVTTRGIRGEKAQPLMPNERISISPVPTPTV